MRVALTGGPPGPYGVQAAIVALHRLGRPAAAAAACREALALAGTDPERALLRRRLRQIEADGPA